MESSLGKIKSFSVEYDRGSVRFGLDVTEPGKRGNPWPSSNEFVVNLCDETAIQIVMMAYREDHFVTVAGVVDGDDVRVMRIGAQGTTA